MIYKTYDWILQDDEATEENARDLARSDLLGESEISEQEIAYAKYIDTIRGVGIYYDYGADYYFFTDETEYEPCGAYKGECAEFGRDKPCGASDCSFNN